MKIEAIGTFRAEEKDKADLPRQGSLGKSKGVIELFPGKNFEQALTGLEGVERVWILFWMDKAKGWKPMVQTPRGIKKGVFATRAPHRPNPIGLSSVALLKVEGRSLYVQGHDLLDGSLVLDVKPYIPYADSFPEAKTGWIGPAPEPALVELSSLAKEKVAFLEERGAFSKETLLARLYYLHENPKANRIESIDEKQFVLSYKEWRVLCKKEDEKIIVCDLFSGYTESMPEDHREFNQAFP